MVLITYVQMHVTATTVSIYYLKQRVVHVVGGMF